MRITVAGANSFIGRRLVKLFSERHYVIAVVREESMKQFAEQNPDIEVIGCSMNNYSELGHFVGETECFINLSWAGSRGTERQNYDVQSRNYECSLSAMKSMAAIGCKILVSAGSQAEYGICPNIITEETPCAPNTEYGKFKLKLFQDTEKLAESFGIRFIEPRYFSLYGPGDYSMTLIMQCMRKMLKNEDINLNDCRQNWDYMYIDDAVKALMMLCENDNCNGVYNFASGENKMLRDFIIEMQRILGSRSRITFGTAEYSGILINLRPSIKKLADAVSWKPSVSFTEGILITARSMI